MTESVEEYPPEAVEPVNEELKAAEEDLQAKKEEFRADKSDDEAKQALRDAKVEVRYQRWLDRNGPAVSTWEKVFKEFGALPGRFLEQNLLDRWLSDDGGNQAVYDEWVQAATEKAREELAKKGVTV
jgi:hypothetical protein